MQSLASYPRLAAIAFLALFHSATFAQGDVGRIISDRVGSQISSGQAGSIFGRMVKLQLAVTQTKGRLSRATYQAAANLYLQQFADGTLLIWDFDRGAQTDEFQLPKASIPVYYDVPTAQLFVIADEQLVRVGRSASGQQSLQPLASDRVQHATASGDGRWLFAVTSGGDVLKLGIDGTLAWRIAAVESRVTQVISNRDGTRVTVLGSDGAAKVLDESGRAVSTLSKVARLGGYDKNGRQVHVSQNRELLSVSAQGAVSTERIQTDGDIADVALSEAGDRVLITSAQGRLSIGRAGKWQQVDSDVKQGLFVSDKRYLSVKNDGVTHLRSVDLAHYLLAIVPGSSGWVIVDHEGRYDGTVAGTNDVRWNADAGGGLSLDQFFDSYYRPGLLSAYVKEEGNSTLGKLPAKVREGVYLPAKVDLDFPGGAMKPGIEYKVVAVAESKGGDLLEEIKLFHNGKRVPPKARIGSQKITRDGKLLLVQVFGFVPEAGPNELFAEVRNSHGVTARSEIKREITGGGKSAGKLYIFGIGIDKYRLSEMNLDFAIADAKTLVSKVAAGAKQGYEQVVPELVIDGAATNQGIKQLFTRLTKLQPEDSLILVLAGHGDIENDEWYFMPHDVDLQNLAKTAISAQELQNALVDSPARNVFLTVDACNSGAGIDSFNKYRAFQRRFAQQVGRNAGISVLTATRRDQQAAEVRQLGHGLFTHVILEGLGGAADMNPKDGKISAHELADFVGRNLEEKGRPFLKSHGLAQSPAHFVIGTDFLIGDVGL